MPRTEATSQEQETEKTSSSTLFDTKNTIKPDEYKDIPPVFFPFLLLKGCLASYEFQNNDPFTRVGNRNPCEEAITHMERMKGSSDKVALTVYRPIRFFADRCEPPIFAGSGLTPEEAAEIITEAEVRYQNRR